MVAQSLPALAEGNHYICERINTPAAKLDASKRQQNEDKMFGDWHDGVINYFGKHHRSTAYGSQTEASIDVQETFFKALKTTVHDVCKLQLEDEKKLEAFRVKVSSSKSLSGEEMCARFTEVEGLYTAAGTELESTNTTINSKLSLLRSKFLDDAKTNVDEVKKITNPIPVPLWKEISILWGSNAGSIDLSQQDFKTDPNSFYGGILGRLEKELLDSKKFTEQLSTERTRMAQNAIDCKGAAAILGRSDVTGGDDDAIKNTPAETPGGNFGPTDDDAAKKKAEEEAAAAAAAAEAKKRAGAQPPPVITPPPAQEEGWLSRNKGTLLVLGAGAAAVGGILWYKKSQDKKKSKEADEMDEEARLLASNNSGSSSSDTSTSTSMDSTLGGTPASEATPLGSKLVVSGIPAGAQVNSNLTEITVAIIDPKGILTQDNNTDITVSCDAPVPCSITGTLTSKSQVGKAKFNDIRFNEAHSGVRLKFTAVGFEPVVSGITFDVTR
jgi:hypothetical protein